MHRSATYKVNDIFEQFNSKSHLVSAAQGSNPYFASGSCQGSQFLGLLADKDNAAECLLECKDVTSCEGYTWDSDSKYCILWDSCSSIEIGDDCKTCVSGMFWYFSK